MKPSPRYGHLPPFLPAAWCNPPKPTHPNRPRRRHGFAPRSPNHHLAPKSRQLPAKAQEGSITGSIPLRFWAPRRSTQMRVPPALLACARYVVPPLSFRKWPPAVQEGPRKFQSIRAFPCSSAEVHHLCGGFFFKKVGSPESIASSPTRPRPQYRRPSPKHPCHFGSPGAV